MILKNAPVVQFSFNGNVALSERKRLKAFIISLFKENEQPLDLLHYTFCTDEEILAINQQYLNHNYYTDIITFDLRERSTDAMVGEIFIGVDTVRSNAQFLGEPFLRELHRVIFHGVLHLCGYNDKSEEEQAIMRKKEDECLLKYFR
ncbi:rRNA maturation RNase YbeY [Niabella ginsenosidivorans]|uniref:Endoribonuclease YbeY n=1 Tax=Niabella ginsenosidivorans TaxID=1176587 RepID=A0A1A9I7W6_9BACT|nr:rRNA maturation RNase YbeY [Niabella ginsenosidivorans]ANH83139.1 rRNA maturation RNase YbeY [Niabella ginsenosidivorans]